MQSSPTPVKDRYIPRLALSLLQHHIEIEGTAIHVMENVMELLLIILVVFFLFGGGGYYGYRRWR